MKGIPGFCSGKDLENILATAKKKKAAAERQALEDKAWDDAMANEIRAIEECPLDPSDPDYPY